MKTKSQPTSFRQNLGRQATVLGAKRAILIASAFALGLVLVRDAAAIPDHPSSARGFASDMVSAYRHCDPSLVSDVTQNPYFPRPACAPSQLSSPTCGFATGGKGKVKMKVLPSGDVSYKLKMKRLDSSCNGQQLDFVVKYEQTNDDCSGGIDCTTVGTELVLGSCTVSGGSCSISSTFNTDSTVSLGGAVLAPGRETSLAMDGCGLFLGNELAFRCGLYIP